MPPDATSPRSRCILVLGPHRSGTSAVTRVLNLLGVELGENLLGPQSDNRRGYFEHRRVLDLHERLLSAVGSSWHDYRPLPLGWRELEPVLAIRAELRELLQAEFAGRPLWGVKDPRLSRLVPLWLDVLDEIYVEAVFVVVVRNPLEVVRSLETRNRFSGAKARLLYLSEMLSALEETAGRERAFVSFDRLLADWRGAVAEIERALGFRFPKPPDAIAADVDAFLRPSERHHLHSRDDLEREPGFPEWGRALYGALASAARGDSSDLDVVFERARESFRAASDLFDPETKALEEEIARQAMVIRSLEAQEESLEAGRWQRRAVRAETELAKVQGHLTKVLASPLYRWTRGPRRWLEWVRRVARRLTSG